jgi:hypothetical protein
MRRAAGAMALMLVALATPAAHAGSDPAPPEPQRVTVIGDSVLTAVLWNAAPLEVLQHALDVDMEVEVCRRLTGVSCPFEGQEAPTLMDTVRALGPRLRPTVVVEVGYNDFQDTFAENVEQSVSALVANGAKRILWLNLREAQQQYPSMNAALVAAAQRHPELTVVDWNSYARDHAEWFQNDGIHLVYPGAIALATLIHTAIVQPPTPPVTVTPQQAPPQQAPALAPRTQQISSRPSAHSNKRPAVRPMILTARLPNARVGQHYVGALKAGGGVAPFRWKLSSGALPKGLRLEASGRITGTPTRALRASFVVSVTDGHGAKATRRELIVVGSARAHA